MQPQNPYSQMPSPQPEQPPQPQPRPVDNFVPPAPMQPNLPPPPHFQNPVPPPQPLPHEYQNAPQKPSGQRKLLARVGIVVALILIVGLSVVVFMLASSKKAAAPTPTPSQQSNGPQAATSLDVESANNSINDDISSVHDDTDFPATTLEDKTLGL